MLNYEKFYDGIEDIFAAFGKKTPEDKTIQAIYKRIQTLPDAFMDYAVKHFEDQEQLPKNMGRYLFRELWPEYLERNPEMKRSEVDCCPNCISDIPGWRKVYKQETTGWGEQVWKPIIARCACGNAPNPGHEPVYTDFELENMGYKLKLEFTPEQKEMHETWRASFKEDLDGQNQKIMEQDENEDAIMEDF